MQHLGRRQFLQGSLALTGLGLLSACGLGSSLGLGPARVPRIGLLMPVSSVAAAANIEALRQGLREHGYVEGQSVLLEYRYADGKVEPLPEFAAELVRLQVDAIVTWGTPSSLAAKGATETIPIVMAAVLNPVELGLVASLARPGGNITGLTVGTYDLSRKSLQLLTELLPGIARIAMMWNPDNPNGIPGVREMQAAAQVLNLQIQFLEVRALDALEPAFAAIVGGGADALFAFHEPLFFEHQDLLVQLAARSRLPAMYERREYVEAGGLMSYGVSFRDNFRRAATLIDKIIKGTKPADLPVEQPTRFDFVINLKTAQALGLTIPQSVLVQATEVFQ